MKKYITPNMDIRIFSDLTETTDPVTSSATTPYVNGLETAQLDQKAQINLNKMADITKFSF